MSAILQLVYTLDSPPTAPKPAAVRVRNYLYSSDIRRCLSVRAAAFAEESPRVAEWSEDDFQREILSKSWWKPERLWMAENEQGETVGVVTLAQRGRREDRPAVHWLAVLPSWRRRGVGRLLIAHLQQYCWDHGWRRIYLETHAGWTAAAAFYRQLGWGNDEMMNEE